MSTNTEHSERKHAEHSPSALKSYSMCPSFGKRDGTNPAAERGTLMHTASETLDFSGLFEREVDAVREYLMFIEEAKEAMPGCTELTEVQVFIDAHETTFGFLDKALISTDGTHAHIADLKTGVGSVEPAEHNKQGKAYALGLLLKYPKLRTVTVSFFKPFQYPKEDSHTFTVEALRAAYDELVGIIGMAKLAATLPADDWSMAQPHNDLCRFCGKLKDCPKGSGIMSAMGKHLPVAFIDPTVMLTSEEPEELGRIMDLMRYLEDYMKPVRNRITEMAKQGKPPEGYELVSVATREVVNEDAVATALLMELKDLGLTEEEAFERVRSAYTVRLSTAEGILSDSAAKGKKRAAKAKFGETLLVTGAVSYTAPKTWLKRITKAIAGGDAFEAKGDDWI